MRLRLLGALAALLAVPAVASARPVLLDRALSPPVILSAAPALAARADDEPPAPGSLDFDLLGEAKPPPEDPGTPERRRRRRLLGAHEKLGLGLVALQLATTTVGQLNYSDKFGDANTDRFELSHKVLAYTNLAVFATQGLLGVLAPDGPRKARRGVDRVTIHKLAMFTAAAGMAAQAGLGIYTARREGFADKQDFGRIHLAVGYVTLAALLGGVSAFVF